MKDLHFDLINNFKCKKCGAIRKNKSAIDDNEDLLIKLTVNGGDLSFS